MVCIHNDKIDPNCAVYNPIDFSCDVCNNSLHDDRNLERCQITTDPDVKCLKAVSVGTNIVCVVCPISYIPLNGGCVKSTFFCATLSSSGICL